ncbi:MAG: PAS domain S-box protein [Betaproteobacteria bacterium]|nr:PAS domain S-box protein [Betaproteobacteria bacterium]
MVIWLSGLGVCLALAAGALLLDESMYRDAKRRAWQDLAGVAVAVRDDLASRMQSGGRSLEESLPQVERFRLILERLSGNPIAILGPGGRLLLPRPGPAAATPQDPWTPEVLQRISAAGGTPALEFRHAGEEVFVAMREVAAVANQENTLRVLVLGTPARLFADLDGRRRQLAASTVALVVLLLVMTGLVSAYVSNRLRWSAALEQREARLAVSEAQLLEAQTMAKVGSWEMGNGPDSFVATQGFYDIHQVTAGTAPRSLEDYVARFLVDPGDVSQARAHLAGGMPDQPVHGVRHVRLDDGTRKWIEFKFVPLFDAQGRKTGARGVVRDITAEHEALAEMAQRTAELEQAKEIAGLGTWSMDATDGALRTCAQMMRIYGTTASNHPKTMREWAERFLPDEDKAEFWPQLEACFHCRPFDRERRIISQDGQVRWIRTIAKPEFDASGRLVRYHGITLDVTPAKTALLALASRTAQLERAQQLGRMGSWVWNIETDRVEFSAQHRAIYGLPQEGPAHTMSEWIERHGDPEEKAQALARLALARQGHSLNDTRRVRDAHGRPMWIHVVAEPVRDATGRVVMVNGITRDITGEKRREAELMETARRLYAAQRIARLGHFHWDLATDQVETFGAYDQVFGLTPGRRFRTMREWHEQYCHPDDREAGDLGHAGAAEAGHGYTIERRSRMPDGSYRWVEISGEPVHDAAGRLTAYRGVVRDIHDAKTAQQQLAESEARFRLISESMHEHVALHDPAGRILYNSPSTRTLLGYSASKSIGLDPFGNVHPQDVDRVRGELTRFVSSSQQEPLKIEMRFRHRAGHFIWLETVVVPVRDAGGTLLHFQSSSRDITARRIAEDQLRESEERFRMLTEVSSDWYWETDDGHRISFLSVEVNPEIRIRREDALGRTRWEAFPDALTEDEWARHRATLAAREPFQGQVLRVREGGQVVGYSSISGRPVFGPDGRFLGYRGTGRDISRIKRAEQRLADSEQRLRLITQNIQDIVSVHDLNGKLAYLSPSFEAVTGRSAASVSHSVRRLFHPEDRRLAWEAFGIAARSPAGASTVTARLLHASGRHLWFEAHMMQVAGLDGTPQVQIVSRDVTRKHEAERQLERRTAELARTNRQLAVEVQQRQELERNVLMTIEMELARVGLELHDQLGQDLTGVSLMVKTLERRLAESSPGHAANALKISELVNNTIRHTRMISHGLSPYIWGSDGLTAALSQLASDITALGVVEVRCDLDRSVDIRDELAARSLYRIAQEASNNALKHSRATRIDITLRRRHGAVILKVSDDGVGSLPDTQSGPSAESRFHSIRHRCSVIGASMAVRHPRRGGTSVRIQWQNPAATPAPAGAVSSREESSA